MRRDLEPERLPPDLESGLGAAEVRARRARYGPNDVVEAAEAPWLRLLRDTAADPMIWFLGGVGALYGALGDRSGSLTLLAMILPLVGMDAWLHGRTQASTAGLASRLASRATVVREGVEREIPAEDLVPGDVVLVGAGASFPADVVLIEAEGVQVDESSLTGESAPARKRAAAVAPSPPADARGFAGTRVLTGSVRAIVVETGRETVYGGIVRAAVVGGHPRSALQRAVGRLVGRLVVAAVALCALLAAVRWWQGHGWADALVSAATLAVAAIPEEFPVVLGFYLGVGVYRLARRQALVRRAVSVEDVGRITAIASDKTGTITEGALRVAAVEPAPGNRVDDVLREAALASRPDAGDPLDDAILAAVPPGATGDRPADRVLARFPFTEDRRRETVIVATAEGARAVVKGSPERVAACCGGEAAPWLHRASRLASEGAKVIAVASREALDLAEPDAGYAPVGLIAFEDPVRSGVPEAIRACRDAGIRIVLVTGDHVETARTIALRIGLSGDVVEGDEIEVLAARDSGALRRVAVVARAVPLQKVTLVKALQASGETVAVTGDGVNDVPALKAADVGIAMGQRGTRSAREVAPIVLLDDDFGTIVGAIAEGRQLFANLRLSFAFLLVVHIPLVLTATVIPLAGWPLLYLPVHVVWLELVVHPTAMLVFQERPASGRLERVTAHPRRFFGLREWAGVLAVGGLATVLVEAGFVRSAELDVEHGRAMALGVLLLGTAAAVAVLTRLRTAAARVAVALVTCSTVALVQAPWTADVLEVRPLHPDDWALVGAAAALVGLATRLSGIAPARPAPAGPGVPARRGA